MKQLALRATILGGFSLALVILLILSVATYRSIHLALDNSRKVAHTQEVISTTEAFFSLLKDAETGQRGYVITGNERYMEPYQVARAELPQHLIRLRILTADNPSQQQHLAAVEPLIIQKLAELQETLDLRTSQGFAAAQAVVLTDQGKQTMDAIRTVVRDIESEEQTLLQRREVATEASATKTIMALVIGNVFAFGLVGLAGFTVNRDLRRRQKAERDLMTLNMSLEQQVADRTAALQQAHAAERIQREYFQTTLASIGDAVIVTDAEGAVTFLNKVAEKVTGWTTAEVTGKPLPEVFRIENEETGEPVENPVAKVLRTGEVTGLANHTVLIRRDGSLGPIDDSAAPIRDERGRVLGVILVFRDITERRKTEQALQDNHALLNAIIEGTLDAVFLKDRQGRYVLINTAGAQWLGKPVEEVLGRTDADLFAPDSVPDILSYDQRVLTTGEPQSYEHTGTAGGNTRTYHSVKVPYRDRHGSIVGVIGMARDISDRARMEDVVRQSEARYRAVSELVSDYAYAVRVEPDGRAELEWVTDAFSRITGFSREELAARDGLAWLILPEDMPSVLQRLQALFADEPGSSEHRIRTKSGEVRWLRDYSMAEWDARHSRIVRIIGAGQDITTHRQAAETSLRLAAIVESSDDAIISKSLDGVVTSWNAAAERIFGYRAEEMIGQSILRLIPEDRHEEEQRILERLRQGERVDHFETVRQTKDGRLLDVSLTSSPLRNEHGTIIGASKIARNITMRKQAEEALARQATELQRINDELQQFSYIVSHDLNEPLRTMSNFVNLLARRYQGKLDTTADEYISFVTEAAQRMQQMITDLLAYTRVGGPTEAFAAVDSEVLLARVLSELQMVIAEVKAEVTHDLLPTVQGDETRLGQVLHNLIGNALKFRSQAPPKIHVSAVREDRHWRFGVHDNGIGIDPQQVPRLFQVFQRLHSRSKYEGTGIGLAICKKIVERHGGRIWVESQPGEGSSFYFTIREKRS